MLLEERERRRAVVEQHHCQQHFRTGDPGQDPYFPPDIDTGFHSSHLVSPPCFRKNSIY